MKKKNKIIVFLGVDGSGKSTVIKSLIKNNKNFETIHLVPRLFLRKYNKAINPHNKKRRGKLFSFFKIIYWILSYYLFEIANINKNKTFFFDRHIYDVIIDPQRYRFSLSKKLTLKIISLIRKPDIIILMTGDPKKIYLRKKEVKLNDLSILNNKYINYIKQFENKIILNSLDNLKTNKKKILKILKNYDN